MIMKFGLPQPGQPSICVRADEIFRQHRRAVYQQTDRVFATLMPIQWLAGIAAAYFFSPLTWTGIESKTHIHVWAAIFLGGAITLLPVGLVLTRPGATITRNIVAISQMLMTGLLIHLSGGRIEMHFHVFGSLAFLAFYRDWRVLIPATMVTTLDHLIRGWFYPMSIYGLLTGGEWRWIEHASWVIFMDIFLIASCRRSAKEMWEIAQRTADLDASEERYRAVVEQTNEGIILVEPETLRIIECNKAFIQLLGCKDIEAAKTLTVYDFSATKPAKIDKFAKSLGVQHKSITRENTFRRLDGTLFPVEVNLNYISYDGRHAFAATIKDITERKRGELELQRLALIAQKIQSAITVTTPEGYVQWVNEGFTRLTGYEPSEIIGKKPGDLLKAEQTSEETIVAIRQAMAEQRTYNGEIYNRSKAGKGYWFSISISPFYNDNGEHQGFISIKMDITERKAMEAELRRAHDEMEQHVTTRTAELTRANQAMQSEMNERKRVEQELDEAQKFLHKIINSLPHPVFVKDEQGKFKLVNTAFAALYGQSAAELIGKSDTDFHPPDEAQRYVEDDQNVLLSQKDKFIPEEKHTDYQGQIRWLQTLKRPLILGESFPRYLLGVCTDLTEQKGLENQLRQAQKLESIGQLAAGIAHEINTPTQYVGDNTRFLRDAFSDIQVVLEKFSGLLEAARTGAIQPALIAEVEDELRTADIEYLRGEVPNAIQQSLDGVSRIAKIVQSMKDFAHPGASEKKAADLNKAIESTLIVARNEWKYVAEMETHFAADLPFVPCLLGEFNQVILNMIVNATHAIKDKIGDGSQGKGKITVTTANHDGKWAEVRITDTGTGIPPAARNRIFDPFFTTKEVGKGTGQGLAISHTVIVEKHNGQLTFETEMGRGTTFIIRLPFEQIETANGYKGEHHD